MVKAWKFRILFEHFNYHDSHSGDRFWCIWVWFLENDPHKGSNYLFLESNSHNFYFWKQCIKFFQIHVELYAYRGNFFEQKIWEVAWLFRGFLGKISLKNKLFQNIFAFSQSAWRADLKNVLIFFIAMNFGNCKQTAGMAEIRKLMF